MILPLKFISLGCSMVTLRSETLLYMSTPQWRSWELGHVNCVECKFAIFRLVSRHFNLPWSSFSDGGWRWKASWVWSQFAGKSFTDQWSLFLFFCPFRGHASIALWSTTAKNTDCRTGPLARPFACSLAPLTRGKVNSWCLKMTWFFPIVCWWCAFLYCTPLFPLSPRGSSVRRIRAANSCSSWSGRTVTRRISCRPDR